MTDDILWGQENLYIFLGFDGANVLAYASWQSSSRFSQTRGPPLYLTTKELILHMLDQLIMWHGDLWPLHLNNDMQ